MANRPVNHLVSDEELLQLAQRAHRQTSMIRTACRFKIRDKEVVGYVPVDNPGNNNGVFMIGLEDGRVLTITRNGRTEIVLAPPHPTQKFSMYEHRGMLVRQLGQLKRTYGFSHVDLALPPWGDLDWMILKI